MTEEQTTQAENESSEGAETLVVISKVKKFIKEYGFNTSSNFCELVSKDLEKAIADAIVHAQKAGRKTVMGKDFNLYVEDPKLDAILVVTSKVKAYIKEKASLSTSSNAIEQLTVRVQQICFQAIESAKTDKRKTVMDRDFHAPTTIRPAPPKE